MPRSARAELRQSILLGLMIGIGLTVAFAGGFFFRDVIGARAGLTANATYPLLDEVQALIDRHYLREQPPREVREYEAIRGMLRTLNDPYTFFIDPPVAASESQVLAGTYGGIGVQVKRSEAGELLLYPFVDSPALKAGIEDGDHLLAVNGASVDGGQSLDVIDQLLRGEVKDGSGVEITLRRGSAEWTVFIEFDVINVPSVVWRVLAEDARLGYVQILRFTNRTPSELKEALTALNTERIGALVVDLRNNTGGLLQESIEVADEFIDDGVIVVERNNRGERPLNGQAGGLATDLPLVVLVNHMTASGAELVAGAIQDRERAMLIGQRTYGKGTVQQIYPLSDKSSLHVTASEWLTPNQQALDGTGLTPDIEMIPDENGRDVELGEAVRQLQRQLTGETL